MDASLRVHVSSALADAVQTDSLTLLGTEERYDHPLGAALDDLWIKHGDTGGAWGRRPSAPEAIAATGLFGVPVCLMDSQQATPYR